MVCLCCATPLLRRDFNALPDITRIPSAPGHQSITPTTRARAGASSRQIGLHLRFANLSRARNGNITPSNPAPVPIRILNRDSTTDERPTVVTSPAPPRPSPPKAQSKARRLPRGSPSVLATAASRRRARASSSPPTSAKVHLSRRLLHQE